MSDDDSDHQKYTKDSRTACKYGADCYQKNPEHHKKYKHLPQKGRSKDGDKHVVKKVKAEIDDKVKGNVTRIDSDSDSEPHVKVTNDVSESETSDIVEGTDEEISDVSQSVEPERNNSKDLRDYITERQFIKDKFLVEMPEDFYMFWDFCKKLKPSKPEEALKEIGLTLVGPFDVLAGKFKNCTKSKEEYLLHWRYYRDPPEFQTVLKGDDKTGYHIGYFRDSPDELPVFLCSNSVKKDGVLTMKGVNIFSAVRFYLEDLKKFGNPFQKMNIGKIATVLSKDADNLQMGEMSNKTDAILNRERKIVTRSFNKIGLVVPYNKKTQLGYRELAMDNKQLNALLTKLQEADTRDRSKYLSQLQPVFTFANIATDECDFGTGIELGWNLISHGVDGLDSTIRDFLVINYDLLNRKAFAQIAEAHMNNRKKGTNLSVL